MDASDPRFSIADGDGGLPPLDGWTSLDWSIREMTSFSGRLMAIFDSLSDDQLVSSDRTILVVLERSLRDLADAAVQRVRLAIADRRGIDPLGGL